jgi:hypothetical protein
MHPINKMIDAVVKCAICGAGLGKCDCWNKKTGNFRCSKCKMDAEYKPALCMQHFAEQLVDEKKPKTKAQRKLWLKQILEILQEQSGGK